MKQLIIIFLFSIFLNSAKGQDTIFYEDKFIECLIVKIDKENIYFKKCQYSKCDFKYDTLWNRLDLENLYIAKQNGIETMEIRL